MHVRLLHVVAGMVAKVDRDHPADAVLRAELKAGGLARTDARAVSRAVFAYERWRGWVDLTQAPPTRVAAALALAERFERAPDSFTDVELLARAVPAWTAGQVAVSAEWVRSLQHEPRLWLRARRGTGAQVISSLAGAQPGPWADSVLFSGEEDLFRTAGFQAGEFEMQDIASRVMVAPR